MLWAEQPQLAPESQNSQPMATLSNHCTPNELRILRYVDGRPLEIVVNVITAGAAVSSKYCGKMAMLAEVLQKLE